MKSKSFFIMGILFLMGGSLLSVAYGSELKSSTMYYIPHGDYKVEMFYLGHTEKYNWNFYTTNFFDEVELYLMNSSVYENFVKTDDTSSATLLAYSNASTGTITLSGTTWYFIFLNNNGHPIHVELEISLGDISNSGERDSTNPAITTDKNPVPWAPFVIFGVFGFLVIVVSWTLIGFGRNRFNDKKERLKEEERLAEIKEKREKAKIQKLKAKRSEKKAETLQERRLREAEEAKKKNLLKRFASLKEQLNNERMITLESYAELAEKQLYPEELKNRKIALNNILEIHRHVKPIKSIRSPWGQISPKPSEIKELLKSANSSKNLFQLIKIQF